MSHADALEHPRPWVHLPVEAKARSFHSRLLLGCCAAERGYGVVVGKKRRLDDRAIDLPAGVFLEKGCTLPALGYAARAGFNARLNAAIQTDWCIS